MLLVLSEAVAHPLPGEDPRAQASAALRLLDRARAVHAPTPTYHLRRAACLERLGDDAAARLERARAERIAPADAFDHLLLGREEFQPRRPGQGTVAPSRSVAAAPARIVLGALPAGRRRAQQRAPRAAEAKTELTACLLQQPSYAWLYLLRGTAYGEMGVALAAAGRNPEDRRAGRRGPGAVRRSRGRLPQGARPGPGGAASITCS